jgi:outer membrane lipoprotein-sorting protein
MIRPLPLALLTAAVLNAATPLDDVMARMDKAAHGFHGVAADLEETVYTKSVDDKTVTGGTIKLKRNKSGDVRFLVEITRPASETQSIAFAGTELRTYKPSQNVEQLFDVATHKAAIEQAMMLGFGATSAEMKAVYDISYVEADIVAGQHAAEIRLVPKTKEMQGQVSEADLWISDSLGVPIQQKFVLPGGNYNLFAYTNLRLTNSLSDSDLQIRPAKGVVINRVGAGKAHK